MSGRSGLVTGVFAKEKIYNYIQLNKNKVIRNNVREFFIVYYDDIKFEFYNEREFEMKLKSEIKNNSLYNLDIDNEYIELGEVVLITNDKEWIKFS